MVPGAHRLQVVALGTAEKDPEGQADPEADEALALQYIPGRLLHTPLQTVALVAPTAVLYLPIPQGVQTPAPAELYVPAGQGRAQDGVVCRGLPYCPAVQFRQVVDPAGLYCPGPHTTPVAEVPPVPQANPALAEQVYGQAVTCDDAPDTFPNMPIAHGVHPVEDDEPATEYCPGGQSRPEELTAPAPQYLPGPGEHALVQRGFESAKSAPNRPGGHAVQYPLVVSYVPGGQGVPVLLMAAAKHTHPGLLTHAPSQSAVDTLEVAENLPAGHGVQRTDWL